MSTPTDRIAFSLTDACPQNCAHCYVPRPPFGCRTVSPDSARAYARQFTALRQSGVRRIVLTGGEPTLADKAARFLSDAAADHGMTSSIVTACHWASSDHMARRGVAALPRVHGWELSTSIYHAASVPVEYIASAARAAVNAGREVLVRVTSAPGQEAEQARFRENLRALLPGEVPVDVRPAVGLRERTHASRSEPRHCAPGGLLVRQDGTFAPCWRLLADGRRAHPFAAIPEGSSLITALERWRRDGLRQLIMSDGMAPVLDWARAADPAAWEEASAMAHTCDCCVRLWESRAVRAEARARLPWPVARANAVVYPDAPPHPVLSASGHTARAM